MNSLPVEPFSQYVSRRKWDERFINLAKHIATWSSCVRRQVGAVIVRDKHVLGTGYNGPPRGAPHRTEETCVRIGIPSGTQTDKVCCAHAESNAVAHAAYHGVSVRGATLYCTTAPCAWCARSIINAGIERVVYDEGYADPMAAQVYAESSVKMEKFTNIPDGPCTRGRQHLWHTDGDRRECINDGCHVKEVSVLEWSP